MASGRRTNVHLECRNKWISLSRAHQRADRNVVRTGLRKRRVSPNTNPVPGVRILDPMPSFPAAAKAKRAEVKGCCRFLDQPDGSEVSPEAILRPYRDQWVRRMRAEPVVSGIRDGTDLDFATRPGLRRSGGDRDEPDGCADPGSAAEFDACDDAGGAAAGGAASPFCGAGRGEPSESKKSFQWIEGFRDCADLAQEVGRGKVRKAGSLLDALRAATMRALPSGPSRTSMEAATEMVPTIAPDLLTPPTTMRIARLAKVLIDSRQPCPRTDPEAHHSATNRASTRFPPAGIPRCTAPASEQVSQQERGRRQLACPSCPPIPCCECSRLRMKGSPDSVHT